MTPSEAARNRQEIRKAFVGGARWWKEHQTGSIMRRSDWLLAQIEAEKRHGKPGGKERGSEDQAHWTVIYDKEPVIK